MNYEFLYHEDFLVIRLSGKAELNERLLVKEYLSPHLRQSCQKIVVDLQGLDEAGEVNVVGILNTIKKEFQQLGGKVKFCSPKPKLFRYFQDNRLEQMFDFGQSIEEIKQRFKEKRNER
jgi:anti-anti-sigma factor